MQRQFVRSILPFILVFAVGCQTPPSEDSAIQETPAAEEGAATTTNGRAQTKLVDLCLETTNMGRALCTCVSEKADAQLSDDGYDFLVATLGEDKAETQRLAGTMSLEETMKAGMFMTKAPSECAKEQAE